MAEGDGVVNTGGIEFHLTDDQGTLTKLKGVKTVTSPHLRVDEVETSDQDSGGTKEFSPGMGEWPDITVTLKHEPNSPTHQLILEHIASKEKRAFKAVVVEEDGSTQDESGVIFLKSYDPDNGQLNNERVATLVGRPGPVTRADSVA
tara:strand:+ start:80 stop:520 length:441 start_codon:yes stop_codon:yes gene_type:complete